MKRGRSRTLAAQLTEKRSFPDADRVAAATAFTLAEASMNRIWRPWFLLTESKRITARKMSARGRRRKQKRPRPGEFCGKPAWLPSMSS